MIKLTVKMITKFQSEMIYCIQSCKEADESQNVHIPVTNVSYNYHVCYNVYEF